MNSRVKHATAIATLCLVLLPCGTAWAQTSQEIRLRDELGVLAEQLERSRGNQTALESELAALREESASLSAKLVEMAARIQQIEAQANSKELRLDRLGAEEAGMRKALAAQRKSLAGLLAGLQILERNPPPPLVTRPGDTVAAIRSAMLFGTVVPELKRRTSRLARDLVRLDELRARIGHEQSELATSLDRLKAARDDMTGLMTRKQALFALANDKLVDLRKRGRALAEKAKSLTQLMASLQREKQRFAAEDAERAQREAEILDEERRRLAAIRKAPPVKFSKARGHIPFPVAGARMRDYGDPDGFGGQTKGMFIATRPAAQVTAPADGKVQFAGNFRSYGELLILDVGEGYHVLIAGLGEISVEPGQFVRAGEPVGQMGNTPARATLIGDTLETDKPILYVEFRRNGGSIDPTPWWAANRKEARR